MPAPTEIAGTCGEELIERARATLPAGSGRGAARAIYKDAFLRGRYAPEAHGLRAEGVAAWRHQFRFTLPTVARVATETAEDGAMTAKAVLALEDGLECECVLLPMGRGRTTLCISSQVGCKMGCKFCETARMGLLRHMTTAEIVSQLLVARHVLGWEFRNVVFMGMGEALDNADNVLPALRVLTDPIGLGMSQERITICTVGNVQGITKLRELGMKRLNLSISLTVANDAQRSALMPVNRKTPLAELQQTLVAYRPRANFVLGVNYCLLPEQNDSAEHAREVAAFCRPIGRVMINVIPYNPGSAPLARAPNEDEIDRFIGLLRDEGLPVRRRVTKGRSVMAACGQLGNVELRTLRRSSLRATT